MLIIKLKSNLYFCKQSIVFFSYIWIFSNVYALRKNTTQKKNIVTFKLKLSFLFD